ncbi:MAG: primosomal protein N', partial [Phycisphaerales bacterium]|nr:primosomal protein N' [Phycisphaerales bacterium]
DQLPRYNARDAAIKRAQLAGAHAVLGSATPSLESWWNATPPRPGANARFRLWELPERVAGRMPVVRIVGPREGSDRATAHTVVDGWIGVGPVLADAMGDTLDAGGQVILLLNRRGFASYVACASANCDWSLGCDACDARMVVHKSGLRPGQHAPRGYLRCHHCLAESIIPRVCPACDGKLILMGLGIQRVERELTDRFGLEPDHDFARLDSDNMRKASDYFSLLDRFSRGELKLLLGTQMVAKGLDFPNVRLVGVINADTSLTQPDFRAAERTFQLVSQVAGRAGRGDDAGLVIVQTMHPGEPSISMAATHDFPAFARQELRARLDNGQPPITRMARVVCRDRRAEAAERDAIEIAGRLRDAA